VELHRRRGNGDIHVDLDDTREGERFEVGDLWRLCVGWAEAKMKGGGAGGRERESKGGREGSMEVSDLNEERTGTPLLTLATAGDF
jgi:hypothetical protein